MVDDAALLSGITAPQEEDDVFALLGQCCDGGIGEGLPAFALMAARLSCLYGEGGIEQQNTLIGPMGQVSIANGVVEMVLVAQFLVYIDQGWRYLHSGLYREA